MQHGNGALCGCLSTCSAGPDFLGVQGVLSRPGIRDGRVGDLLVAQDLRQGLGRALGVGLGLSTVV